MRWNDKIPRKTQVKKENLGNSEKLQKRFNLTHLKFISNQKEFYRKGRSKVSFMTKKKGGGGGGVCGTLNKLNPRYSNCNIHKQIMFNPR